MCFYCLSPCDWCKPLKGWWCSCLKISELAQGFSDGYSINVSQETFCINCKVFFMFLSFLQQCCCLFNRHVYMSFEVSHLWLPFRNDLRTNLRLKSEKAIKKWKKQAKIHTEIWANSDKIGIEKPVPAFQSRIASDQNLMSKYPKSLFSRFITKYLHLLKRQKSCVGRKKQKP